MLSEGTRMMFFTKRGDLIGGEQIGEKKKALTQEEKEQGVEGVFYLSIPPDEKPSRYGLKDIALFKPGGRVAFNK